MPILRINHRDYSLDVSEDMPLLWAIRDFALLTGTKYGCGIAQCGACTILLNGQAVRSCQVTVSQAQGKEITTVEYLENEFPKLLEVWEDINVPQCGYCQSGQLMSAAALLQSNKKPTDEDIDKAMDGNICRCGTYTRIKKAIHQVSQS